LQEELLARLGTRFVFAADELYLKAGDPLPPAEAYEEYGMLEDGVGMVRDFLTAFERGTSSEGERSPLEHLTLATGMLFGPVLAPLTRRMEHRFGTAIRLLMVKNRFLGETITVAGLLGGADVVSALRRSAVEGEVALPSEMVSRANGLLIDDYTPERIAREAGVKRLHLVAGAEGLLRLLREGKAGGSGGGSYPPA
jgi:NifB/MoaA-like Fe-S oxidoreductase